LDQIEGKELSILQFEFDPDRLIVETFQITGPLCRMCDRIPFQLNPIKTADGISFHVYNSNFQHAFNPGIHRQS